MDLSVAPATPVGALPPGEKQLVEIAKALSHEARVMIFDEPTTSLTAHEVDRLFSIIRRLQSRGLAMIYISHVLKDVLRLCDKILVLRDGVMAGTGLAKQMTEEKMVTWMVGRKMEQMFPPRVARISNEPVLRVENLSQPGIVHDISFGVHEGEVLGISGLLGSGRTELARIIFGLAPKTAGNILLAEQRLPADPRKVTNAGVAFLTEDRRQEGLLGIASIAQNVAFPCLTDYASRGLAVLQADRLRSAIERMAGSVRIRAVDFDRMPVFSLSGGNQQKVVLAKWPLRAPKLFILDEPTRGIDVGANFEIYKAIDELAAAGAGVLMITSEIEELMGMCDRILALSKGEITAAFTRDHFDQEAILRAAMGQSQQVRA